MVNPIHTHLQIHVCADAQEACQRGFDWTEAQPPVKPIEVKQAVVVCHGTVNGNPTVDFLLEDESGQRYVFMVTAALLKAISG